MAMMPMGGPPIPNMPMPPNGGGMPGGPMPGGPMPPGAQGGIPPEILIQQMLGGQGPEQSAGGELVGALQGLLDSWTERDPSTLAGQYYQDLANVVAQFMQ